MRRDHTTPRAPSTPNKNEETVINLTDIELTPECNNLLSKGLSYAPTHRTNQFQMKVDLYRFYRNLHLKAWYHNQPRTDSSNIQVPMFKSKFFPHSNNACLHAFVKKVNHDVDILLNTKPCRPIPSNLSRGECEALKWL